MTHERGNPIAFCSPLMLGQAPRPIQPEAVAAAKLRAAHHALLARCGKSSTNASILKYDGRFQCMTHCFCIGGTLRQAYWTRACAPIAAQLAIKFEIVNMVEI